MNKLTCDICGGNLQMGSDGFIVCESCGMKYSPEVIRQKVQQVQVQGPIQIDKSNMFDSYLEMANTAYEGKDYEEAEIYYKKCIEIKPNDAKLWYKKGVNNLYNSIEETTHINESYADFVNALKNATDEQKSEWIINIKSQISEVSILIVDHLLRDYSSEQTIPGSKTFIKEISKIFNSIEKFYESVDCKLEGIAIINKLFNKIINHSSFQFKSKKYFSSTPIETLKDASEKCKVRAYAFGRLGTISEKVNVDYLYKVLIILEQCKSECINLYVTKNVYNEILNGMFTETYFNCPEDVKSTVNEAISNLQSFIKKIENKQIAEQKELEAKRLREEKEKHDKYWDEHKDLFNQLTEEKQTLTQKRAKLVNEFNSSVENKNFKYAKDVYNDIATKINSLGIFKIKEKKLLQEELVRANTELSKCKALVKQLSDDVNSQIKTIDARIAEIENTLKSYK